MMTELEQHFNIYFGMGGEEISMIASLFKPDFLKKGEYYSKTGNACDKLSFVQSGFMRLYAVLRDKEVTHWIGSKGMFIGDLASLTFGIPSLWHIQAVTDTELYTIQKEDYNRIVELIPKWPEMEKHFIIKSFTTMESRIFAHQSMSAEERYSNFYAQNKGLFNQVPLHYIASMLGMAPETFSRIRRKR